MSVVMWGAFLSLVWMLLFGRLTPASALMGLAVGLLVAGFSRWTVAQDGGEVGGRRSASFPSPARVARGSIAAVRLLGFFLVELTKANLQLSRDVLRPRPDFHPALLALDVPDLRPGEVVLLAAMISLTPGTISVDVERDASTLYVHSIYAGDLEGLRAGLREFADRIVAVRGERRSHLGSGVG